MISAEIDKRRETFFKLVFGKQTGYLAIAHRSKNQLFENFYHYPKELPEALEHINNFFLEFDVYFCSQLFGKKQRRKESVQDCPNLWSDLDTCPPAELLVEPSVLIESSPGRYQGLWVLDRAIPAEEAEDYSRRIAYRHSEAGADKSGWDLTQLLRVPYTLNHKYDPAPTVTIAEANTKRYRIKDFEEYPQSEGYEYLEIPFPDVTNLIVDDVLKEHRKNINPRFWTLFYEEPTSDWSKALWQLELLLLESGLSREETFAIANQSACNKYRRDGRDEKLLWKEVCKAEQHTQSLTAELQGVADVDIPFHPILTDEERAHAIANPGFVEDYVEWASTLGDAAWQYHQVGAFTILSALLAGNVRLPTSYGIVLPNMWFMILADTTLTRKTTAMDIAMDLIIEIDRDAVLATDGSIEGLFQSLSTRPGRPSIFLRDEFSGLLEQMTKKDYYAGMAETLTKLYDGKYQKRVLRREVIEVRDPVLIIFAGGIKTRIMELLRYDHVASGFIPRFMFVSAESDITRLRPLGPPTDNSVGGRDKLLNQLRSLHTHYNRTQELKIDGRVTTTQVRFDAALTDDAWIRYNKFEADLVAQGLETDLKDLMTPTFDRMAKSGLKMAVLLAAARTTKGDVIVEESDIVRAFYYVEQWGVHTIDLITNIGKSQSERQLERIYTSIMRKPGISRSVLMQNHHLSSRDANLIFETLEQRGLVQIDKRGRGSFYTATDIRIKL
jgi:hypothetical protein